MHENQMETEHAMATISSSANVQELQYRDVGTQMTSKELTKHNVSATGNDAPVVQGNLQCDKFCSTTLKLNGQLPPKEFVQQVTKQLDNTCTQNYGSLFKENFDQLHEPTVSTKSNRQVQQTAKRQLLRDTRDEIQNQMNANAADIVMGARLSWKTYDTMRTTSVLRRRMQS